MTIIIMMMKMIKEPAKLAAELKMLNVRCLDYDHDGDSDDRDGDDRDANYDDQ